MNTGRHGFKEAARASGCTLAGSLCFAPIREIDLSDPGLVRVDPWLD